MRFHGLRSPDEETIISFDFWETILLNKQSPESHWIETMEILKIEFDLELDAKTYETWFNKISSSIRRLNQENRSDYEYRGERAWAYFSALIFSNLSERIKFQKRAIDIYFQLANSNTILNDNFNKFLSDTQPHLDRIIITSDFEFGRYHIHKLLIEKGITFPINNIYVSSDFLLTKYSGNLFRKLQKMFPGKTLIHIGDDLKSDFIMAKKTGIKTLFRANISTTIFRKLRFHRDKQLSQLKKIPLRLPLFRNDINLLRSVLTQFETFVRKNVYENDWILFLGSEGAFFSNLFTDEFHGQFSTQCVNLGRKEILKELFPFDPEFVIAILLLEEFSINEFMLYLNSFHQISKEELISVLNSRSIFNEAKPHMPVNPLYVNVENCNLKTGGRLIAIDIGYKATFATCLSRLLDSHVLALQLLGFKQIQRKSNLVVKSLQELRVPKYGRAFSTKFLESLLGAGPRSEFSNDSKVMEIQRKILNTYEKRHFKVSKLISFSRLPSKKIRATLYEERIDDFRMEKTPHEHTRPS